MQHTLERTITAGYAVAVGFLLFIGGAAWWSAARVSGTFLWVDHTHQVLFELEATLTDLLSMQTGTRGFLLTGEEQFLKSYKNGSGKIAGALQSLRQLTSDNPRQQERLARLEAAATKITGILRGHIARRQATDSAAGSTEGLWAGKATMDEIRQLVVDMEDEERRLLAERSTAAQFEQRRAMLVFGAGTLLVVSLVTAAGFIVRRNFAQRVKAEAERDRFFSPSLDLLCIAGADGYFKRISPAFTATLGWSVEEMLARPFIYFVHPDDHAPTLREVEKLVVAGEKVLHFENRYRHKDGSWRVLSWKAVPQPGGFIYATAHDVTERKHNDMIKRLNADLQQRATQLETANKELEAFSYSVSHDLRAPLRHIDGFAGLLAKHAAGTLDEKSRHYLDTIAASAKQMGRLIDDLLTFSRMSRAPVQMSEVNQELLIAAVIREGGLGRNDRPAEWRIAPLPRVRADPAMLRQVWFNLLDNAVKYSAKAAAPRIEVGHRPGPAAEEHEFFVQDNGAGFDMRYVDKLFGVFQRLHSDAEFEGTGIGLANVRRIITRHGGRTWAEGRVGEGATFYFSLPREEKAEGRRQNAEAEKPG